MASTMEPLEALNVGLAVGGLIVVALRRVLHALEDRGGSDPSGPFEDPDRGNR